MRAAPPNPPLELDAFVQTAACRCAVANHVRRMNETTHRQSDAWFLVSVPGSAPSFGRAPDQVVALPGLNIRSRCSCANGLVSKLATTMTTEAAITQVPATPNGFFHS